MSLPEQLRLRRDSAALVVIDFQERLFAAMPEPDGKAAARATKILLSGARTLGLPVLVTEQYPKGLGHTLPELVAELAPGTNVLEKLEFDSAVAPAFVPRLADTGKRQVIVAGMEAHICVLQTALGLLAKDYGVFVAADAICSRVATHRDLALRTLERAGAVVLPTESLLFMMLGKAGTPEFKQISNLIK